MSSASCLTDTNGKVYRLLSSEGFPLNPKIQEPTTGHWLFALSFEPVKTNEYSVCFNGDGTEGFHIPDIQLSNRTPARKAIRCILQGKVVGRPSSCRLKRGLNEGNFCSSGSYIPIRDGQFTYELACDYPESYDLIFMDEFYNGSYRAVTFFAENDTGRMTLYPKATSDRNTIPAAASTWNTRRTKVNLNGCSIPNH